MIAGLAYLQYQAQQAGNYAIDAFNKAKDSGASYATSLFEGGKGIFDQIGIGWEKTKEQVEEKEWWRRMFLERPEESTGGNGGSGGQQPGGDGKTAAAAAVATGTAFGVDEKDDTRTNNETVRDEQMMLLTRKMIEIRNMLQGVGQSEALSLPSIVVIGSQSSGKSSVLEAIVGHEFLPKGSNMVTRRPIELTLVNTPDAKAEYGEFPALGLGKITDFSQIQRTLTDLNLAVPVEQCVTDEPIQLTIHSPNVPDLSLIDLPGYIQVVGRDQPVELKQKISDLCDKYIQAPNVILAISAADVDLANSTALRASRRIDPRGERTIGVITKMDLVDPQRGAEMLSDKKYPLRLGYVGVVCKIPQQTNSLFTRHSGNLTNIITRNESAYFQAHPIAFGPQSELSVGTSTLRKKLMHVLEQTMASSLGSTRDAIVQELEEATYEFKVQYNDRPLSAESYLAESLDAFKHSFKQFSDSFGRPEVRQLLKAELEQKVLDLLAKRYWNKPAEDLAKAPFDAEPISDLSKPDPPSLFWQRKLDASTSELTKLGIGRLATSVVEDELKNRVQSLVDGSTFAAHPFARRAIADAAESILHDRFYSTSDQVENCIKPFKFEIEIEEPEWTKGREGAGRALKSELKACEAAQKQLEQAVGRRKLNDVIGFVDRVRKGDVHLEGDSSAGAGGFSSALLQTGRQAIFLRDRADILKMRLAAVKSRQCSTLKNKYHCPEVFLDVVADKLTSTAVLFLNVELLSEFYYNFPRELDARLGRHLSDSDIERFAREDPKIKRHLDLIQKKEMLELVLEKIESLRQLEGKSKAATSVGGRESAIPRERERSRWSLF
ncbi:mitochondrial dynamin GTPase Msp1 [Lithohypha guttulata]|nr:mitochondrial dynamin GTPase Msp1 [Lithohypha guttulata]